MAPPDTATGTVNGGQTVRFLSIIVSYIHVDNADGFAMQIWVQPEMDELFVSMSGCSDPSNGRRNRKYRQAIVITVRSTRN